MNCYIVESAFENGSSIKYLSCVGDQHWVDDIADASRFVTTDLAENLADDWQDFYAMKGIGRLTNITTHNDERFDVSRFDVDSEWSE